jgi:hypothetical protein
VKDRRISVSLLLSAAGYIYFGSELSLELIALRLAATKKAGNHNAAGVIPQQKLWSHGREVTGIQVAQQS